MITYETRSESYEKIDKNLRYSQILEILDMYKKGYIPTDERNFTAPRLTELSIKGIVEPTEKKKCSYTGKTVSMYRIR